ncbi:hypothetical protein [Algoriphagus marinus]|uniref:hypothetical protein n=1 Tax=Algoriphagus marinus TaxID=1925762 RepID=UPI0011152977|nr:hypothetical protein [Algoriphagus marinus]
MKYLFWINLIIFTLTSQKAELDSRLVGQWTMLFSLDSNGEVIKDEFYGKKYVEEFTNDGKLILDPNFFIDDMKRHGETIPMDYTLIPSIKWETINNNTLRVDLGEYGTRDNRYGFLGDTLIFGYSNGTTRYLLKRNKD